jgi:hypothetical protein
MHDYTVQDGWQEFLDRLRRLWGRPRGGLPGPLVNTQAVEHAGQLDVWEDEGGASARSRVVPRSSEALPVHCPVLGSATRP